MSDFCKKEIPQADIAEQFQSATGVLNSPLRVIIDRFSDREPVVVDCHSSRIKEKYIEIKFDSAVLTCLLDNDNICTASNLYLHSLASLMRYIDHCNRTYIYDHSLRAWITQNAHIHIAAAECLIVLHHIDREKSVGTVNAETI